MARCQKCCEFPNEHRATVPTISMRARICCFSSWNLKLVFDVFQVDDSSDMLYPAFLQAMNPWHLCHWVLERDAALFQSSVGSVSSDCVAAIHADFTVGVCQSQSVRHPSSSHMQHRMPVAHASAQAVGFKCINCKGIFDSCWSLACHSGHRTSKGTPCADTSSIKSLSFTGRSDTSTGFVTGILREHPGTVGAFSNSCSRCVLLALLQFLLVFSR